MSMAGGILITECWIGSYTGVAANENGWWYITNGAVDWNFTRVGENSSGWWYFNNGCLNWNYNGSVSYKGNTYKVINGWVDQNLSWVNDLKVSKECSQLVIVSVYIQTMQPFLYIPNMMGLAG